MNTIRIYTSFLLTLIDLVAVENKLILVHVVFRHGHRTPDENSIYPNDPYRNETYYPDGLGQLTNEGKFHEYKLGRFLRHRYNTFLDDIYTTDLIDARSTAFNRTKMSLELVLAALFPPKDNQIWLKDLNWQPIPYNYSPEDKDEVLLRAACPNYLNYFQEYTETEEYQHKLREYREIFQYIEENSGLKNMSFNVVLDLYFCLETENNWGFKLPEWTKPIYPDILRKIAIDTYRILSATTSLKKITAGYLLKKIIDDSVAKLNGTLVEQKRRIFLYSGHDLNVAFLMQILGFIVDEVPAYGSAVLIELHRITGRFGFKIYREKNLEDEPVLLRLPNCGEFCPIDRFKKLYQQYFADISFCDSKRKCNNNN